MRRFEVIVAVFVLLFFVSPTHASNNAEWLIIPGVQVGKITAKSSEVDLKKAYGEKNVKTEQVGVGEGKFETGTVLFPNESPKKVEILWHDSSNKQNPKIIRFTGDKSVWKTAEGVSLGITLKELENMNAKPFSLAGFGWDYGGTVYSWKGGKLEESLNTKGMLFLRLAGTEPSPATRQELDSVQGEKEFSSMNPAMQKINPRVYQMTVKFWRVYRMPRR